MKSIPLPSGSTYYAHEHNALRADSAASAWLKAHQQLGALALGTNPSNNQTVTLDINGTNVVFTFVTSIGSAAGNVLIGASAAASVTNLYNLLINPTTTTSTGIALSAANAQLVQYLGYGLPAGGTTITPYSLNNSTYGPLTSFTASTTVTSGSWTAQTLKLYVEPGTYFLAGTRYLFLGGSTPTVTAPSSHPRIDVLTIDSSGTLAWTTGTENASPVAPAYPAAKLPICELYNVVGETALYDNENQQSNQGYIYNDVRQLLANPYGQFILDPGSEAQGDTLYYSGSAWVRLPAGTNGQYLQTGGAGANPSWTSAAFLGNNAALGVFSITGTGNASVTGLSFKPSLVLFFVNWSGSSGATEWSGQATGSMTASQQASSWSAHTVSSGSNVNGTSTSVAIVAFNNSGLAQTLSAAFVSFNSDGFTVNASTASVAQNIFYIAFK